MSRDGWKGRDRAWISLAIFLLALVVRLVHIAFVADAPYFPLRMGDAADHHRIGLAAAGGDWVGTGVLFHAPLYPYFLGAVYSLFGSDPLVVRGVQAVLGALSCVFVAQAAGRLFSRREAIAAGALLALYGPAVFYDTTFQDSVLDLFFASLAVWAIVEAVVSRRTVALFLAGLAIGGFYLTRENGLILVVPLVAWLAIAGPPTAGRRVTAIAIVLAGLATAVAPVAARNAAVTGRLFPGRQLQLGINLYIGNNPEADGYYRPLREGRGNPRFEMEDAVQVAEREAGRELTVAEASNHWIRRTVDYVRTDPVDWLALMARKAALAVGAVEAADTEDLYTYAERSPVLAVLSALLGFGTLLALGVLGVFVTWPDRRRLWVFYLLPALYMAGLIAFFVFGRYRHPVAPSLVLLAAPAVVALPAILKEREPRMVTGLAIALAVLAFSFIPIGLSRAQLRAHTHANVGAALEERGEPEEAARQYLRALEIDPRSTQANRLLGDLLRRSGRPDAALPYLDRAVRGEPGSAPAWNDYGAALAALDRKDEAAERFERAIALDPALGQAQLNLGLLDLGEGRSDSAIARFRRGVRALPADPEARRLLATGLLLDGRLRAGLAQVDTLAELASPGAAARVVLQTALRLAADGGPDDGDGPRQALDLLEAAPAFVARDIAYHRARAAALAAAGEWDEAVDAMESAIAYEETNSDAGRPGLRQVLENELDRYRRRVPPRLDGDDPGRVPR